MLIMRTHNTHKGFTLIELMVSVAIFTMVMVVALGALLSIAAAERKAETIKSVISNLDFALDSMSRSIRTGINYDCNPSLPVSGAPTNDCAASPGATSIGFQAVEASLPGCIIGSPCMVVYCLGNAGSCNSTGTSILRSINNGTFLPITSSDVIISNFTLYVKGSSRADQVQPKVTITISGFISLNGDAATQSACIGQGGSGTAQCSAFNIQTSVTQRLYDQ